MKKRNVVFSLLFCILLPLSFSQAVANDWIYHAKQDDTLWDLCIKYTSKRGCWLELGKYNQIKNDRTIQPGEEIRIPLAWLTRLPVVGKAVAISGDVSYRNFGEDSLSGLAEEDLLHLGSVISTAEGSARILLGSETEVLIRANSILELNTLTDEASQYISGELELPAGEVEVSIDSIKPTRFEISTPSAVAAVRGTEYRVNASEQSTRGEVLQGLVNVSALNSNISIPAGFGVKANKGEEPGQPRQLLPAPTVSGDYSATPHPATISWEAHPEAKNWHLDIFSTGGKKELVKSIAANKPSLVLGELDEGCYQLALRAIDDEGFNGLNNQFPLCVVPRLGQPDGISKLEPPVEGGPFKLSWNRVEHAVKYRVDISDSTFSQVSSSFLTTDTSIALNRSSIEPFSIRVIAIDAAGNESDASQTQSYKPKEPCDLCDWITVITAFIIIAL